jgi:hypothetical protein
MAANFASSANLRRRSFVTREVAPRIAQWRARGAR